MTCSLHQAGVVMSSQITPAQLSNLACSQDVSEWQRATLHLQSRFHVFLYSYRTTVNDINLVFLRCINSK